MSSTAGQPTEARTIYDPVSDTPASYLREGPGAHPRLDDPEYRSTRLRHLNQLLVYLPHTVTEITGPQLGPARILGERDNDLTVQHADMPIGERIVVSGAGRCVTDSEGRYTFTTIKPGAYPWGNHYNAWRPAHIHFSLLGRAFAQRLVTQMYFPGDPFFPYDPIFNSVRDPEARTRMISRFDIHNTVPNWAQAYEFDIVLRGPGATRLEDAA